MTGEEVQAAIVAWLRWYARSTERVEDEIEASVWRSIALAIERGDWLTKGMDDGHR